MYGFGLLAYAMHCRAGNEGSGGLGLGAWTGSVGGCYCILWPWMAGMAMRRDVRM